MYCFLFMYYAREISDLTPTSPVNQKLEGRGFIATLNGGGSRLFRIIAIDVLRLYKICGFPVDIPQISISSTPTIHAKSL